MRMDANYLFCGRSGLAFEYEIAQGQVTSTITRLEESACPQTAIVKPRKVIGVGNVGRIEGQATYTLYNPNINRSEFKTVRYGDSKGFQLSSTKQKRL